MRTPEVRIFVGILGDEHIVHSGLLMSKMDIFGKSILEGNFVFTENLLQIFENAILTGWNFGEKAGKFTPLFSSRKAVVTGAFPDGENFLQSKENFLKNTKVIDIKRLKLNKFYPHALRVIYNMIYFNYL